MKPLVPLRDGWRSSKELCAEFRQAPFWRLLVWQLANSAPESACSPFCLTRESATSARSCFLEMLCASLAPEVLEDIFNSDLQSADCVEIRLDYLKNPQQSLHASWNALKIPVIATCLRTARGGRFTGTLEDERIILQSAARNGAAFVDMDYRDAAAIPGVCLIGSYHNFEETPDAI